MREFNQETFDGWGEFNSGRTHRDVRFTGCIFQSCSLALSEQDLSKRPRVVNAELRKCAVAACNVTATVFEDVLVEGLKTSGPFQTWAAVFKHVTLRGRVDRVMFNPFFHPGYPESKFQQVVARANADYYAAVDWALDIREAEFLDFDCRGLPSRLVRRDPQTQAVVTRERLLGCGDAIRAGGPLWESWLKQFVQDAWYADEVLVAPKRSPKFKELITGLDGLRRNGVLEAD